MMTPTDAIPTDPEAERAVIGVVLLTPFGLPKVAQLVTADDFHNVTLGRLFEAAGQLDDVGPFPHGAPDPDRPSSVRVRIGAASVLTDVPLMVLGELVNDAPVMTDASPWARKVAETARRRRAMTSLVAAFNALGSGSSLDRARELLAEEVAA